MLVLLQGWPGDTGGGGGGGGGGEGGDGSMASSFWFSPEQGLAVSASRCDDPEPMPLAR